MRFLIHEPQPLAAPKQWRWEIVDKRDKVLAESPPLESEQACRSAIDEIQAAFKDGEPLTVKVRAPRP